MQTYSACDHIGTMFSSRKNSIYIYICIINVTGHSYVSLEDNVNT
jgi:hypothetical protein